jgi:hypothetical protein
MKIVVLLCTVAALAPFSLAASQLTGCLNGPNSENFYMLVNKRYPRGVELSQTENLKNYVGNRVQLTGEWAGGVDQIAGRDTHQGAKMEKNTGREQARKHFKVDNIKKLADSCALPAETKAGGKQAKQ